MKRLIFFLLPIILAISTFSAFSYYLSQSGVGKGALQVTSLPQSNVYLNNKLIGKTPLCKCEGKDMLPTGDYTVKLVPIAGDNLSSFEQRITITKSILTVVDRTFGVKAESSGFIVSLTPLSDTSAISVFLSSFPSDARVTIDGNDMGKTPLLIKTITASDHDVTLSKDGYTDKTIHVHTNTGYQLNASISLAILPPDASTSANFQNAALTPIQKPKIVILQTPTGFLRVRSEPSLAASESGQVKPGEVYDFVDEQEGWYKIKLSPGQEGWVSASYAQKQ
jgi:hypothetical protein